ncbi:MAG: hypothetical protein ACRDAU_09625 [Clostridium sp.]
MLTLKKDILINSTHVKNKNLNLLLNSSYSSCKKEKYISHSKIKIKDSLKIYIFIKNTTESALENFTLTLIENSIFEYIPCSLINLETREPYLTDIIAGNKNMISLPLIKSSSVLTLQFYVKVHLENLDFSTFNTPLSILNIDSNEYNEYLNHRATPYQSALNITIAPSQNSITFRNIGSAPCENIIYHHIMPNDFKFEVSKFKYIFENMKCNVSAINIDNHILFQIDSLPESNSTLSRSLKVEFTDNSNDYFLKTNCSLK